jgi:hypothetical protein
LYPDSVIKLIDSAEKFGVGLSIETMGYKKSAVIPVPNITYGVPFATSITLLLKLFCTH